MQMDRQTGSEDVQLKLKEASNSYQRILQYSHNQALLQNELQTKRWEDYRREHDELRARLLSFRDQIAHKIMVPFGKRALMRGSLVHTNEILVCLGDGWFAKKSAKEAADVCQRRIQHCDEMLKKLKKEEELLTSRVCFPFENEAFGVDETEEIVEPYDEVAEKQWKERHRQKEIEYRQKLAELKKSQKTKIATEEDLWKRLDVLDLQEELEDELNRMDDDLEENEETEDESESDSSKTSDTEKIIQPAEKRRVSFKEDKNADTLEEDRDSDDSFIHIFFKHSDVPSAMTSETGEVINSPADIYKQYKRLRMPKSILRTSSSSVQSVEETEKPVIPLHNEDVKQNKPVNKAVLEVIERVPTVLPVSSNERPVSRFKAARMASKR